MEDTEFAVVLRRTMADLTATVARPTDVAVTLHEVTTACVELMEGADCADVLLITDADRHESLAATSSLPLILDREQKHFGEGPCIAAAAGHTVTRCDDFRHEPRWPRFARAAVDAGVLSALSFQLCTHDQRRAALNVFSRSLDAFSSDDEAVGAMLATHAAIALIAADKQSQFESALASRDIIGQAKGKIMERFGVDAVRAFELLSKLSQDSNMRVADVAAQLVAQGPSPS